MKGESIIIIPKSQENEVSFEGSKTWLKLAESLVNQQGSVIHRKKDDVEYLCLQCDLTPSQKSEISHPILSIKEYFNYGWDKIVDEP